MLTLIRRAVLAGILSLAAATAAAAQDPNRLFTDSKLVVRDRISVEVVGKGPDVLFIPGLSSSRATWRHEAQRLRGRYRLHLVQIAGFAGEAPRGNAGSGDVFVPTAEAIAAYLGEQKQPAIVVGHSLGGSMALYLAQKHPARVKKAMIVDSMPLLAQAFGQNSVEGARPMATAMRDGMMKGGESYAAGSKASVAGMVVSAEDKAMITGWALASDPSVSGRAMYDLMLFDQRAGLAGLKVPVTVVHPDNVPGGMPKGMMAGYYKAAYAPGPSVKVVLVENARHFVMFDQRQAFEAALDAFLASP